MAFASVTASSSVVRVAIAFLYDEPALEFFSAK